MYLQTALDVLVVHAESRVGALFVTAAAAGLVVACESGYGSAGIWDVTEDDAAPPRPLGALPIAESLERCQRLTVMRREGRLRDTSCCRRQPLYSVDSCVPVILEV